MLKHQTEAEIKKQLMAEEFQYNMQLEQAKIGAQQTKEKEIEDRKDNRTKLQATQQSEMISQRQNDSSPQNFEDPGFINLAGYGNA